jgi:hypothetical protein
VVLATQNPVDLDYKGLANTGTWFIGRLQTERDKDRVMEGLEGAAASAGGGFDRQKMEQLLAGLGSRVFLMNNTHEDAPAIFQTRWSLSYLRGPLTRAQIKQLMDPRRGQAAPGAGASAAPAVSAAPAAGPAASAGLQPALPADIPQFFVPLRGSSAGVVYQPMAAGGGKVHFSDAKARVDATRNVVALTPILDQVVAVNWEEAQTAPFELNDLEKEPAPGVKFGDLPGVALKPKNFAAWSKAFGAWLYGSQALELWRSPSVGALSNPGESERDFRIRLQQAAREQRDETTAALRQKYAPKIAALQEKVRKAEQAVQREVDQANQAKMQTVLSVGATLLGAFTGRKLASASNISKASSAVRGVGRSMQQQGDVGRAKETVETYKGQLEELNAQFKEESEALEAKIDPATEALEKVAITPKKADIEVQVVALVWAPYRLDSQGKAAPAW